MKSQSFTAFLIIVTCLLAACSKRATAAVSEAAAKTQLAHAAAKPANVGATPPPEHETATPAPRAQPAIAPVAPHSEQEKSAALIDLTAVVQSAAAGKSLDVALPNGTLMRFVGCPAGDFQMGSPPAEKGRADDEKQVHVQISKSFWLARTEVTQGPWRAVMGKNTSHYFGSDELPVAQVNWAEAQSFIMQLNQTSRLPAGWKFALPSEAQWEYACRAGTTGPFAGSSLAAIAWYNRNSGGAAHEVAAKQPNSWGLYDMYGNVSEWCADWHHDPLAGGVDPAGAATGSDRVARGGAWDSDTADCRAANRGYLGPESRSRNVGFRPALVPLK